MKHTSVPHHPNGSSWLLPQPTPMTQGLSPHGSCQNKGAHECLVLELQERSKEPQANVVLLRESSAPTQCWILRFLCSSLGLPSMQLIVTVSVCVC